MPSPREVAVVVVAAGRGERAGGTGPKQYQPVAGVPMVLRAVRPFLASPSVGRVIVALPPNDVASPPAWLAAVLGPRLVVVAGGDDRMASVEAGLAAFTAEETIAVVHDGARPFVSPSVIEEVVAVARRGLGGIAAVPMSDTLKEGSAAPEHGGTRIVRTVARDTLWRAQTPQAFPVAILRRALAAARAAGTVVTDEASAVESIGSPVLLVMDRTTNLKVTTREDFVLAEALAGGGS